MFHKNLTKLKHIIHMNKIESGNELESCLRANSGII